MTGFNPKAFVENLTGAPGIYRMLDANGEGVYVGKAPNLRKRVGSYFARGAHSGKTHAMLRRVAGIEVTVTHTVNEALRLEANLIKSLVLGVCDRHLDNEALDEVVFKQQGLEPRYNILLRDDK